MPNVRVIARKGCIDGRIGLHVQQLGHFAVLEEPGGHESCSRMLAQFTVTCATKLQVWHSVEAVMHLALPEDLRVAVSLRETIAIVQRSSRE